MKAKGPTDQKIQKHFGTKFFCRRRGRKPSKYITTQKSRSFNRSSNVHCVQAGRLPCRGNNLLQPYSLEKAFYSEKDLPEYYAQQIFVSWLRYHAPMICPRANRNYTNRCFSLSIPAIILTPQSNKSELFRDRHPNGRIAIVADHYRLGELVSAFRAGANGFFVDVMTCDVFIKSIELVMMGETIFPPAFLSFVLDPEINSLEEVGTARRTRNGRQSSLRRRTRSRRPAFPAGEINSALPDRRRLQQMHSAKDRYRRGDREGPRQGDPSQDPGPEPDPGGDLGDEQRIPAPAANNNCPLSPADASKLLAKPVPMISEIKQIEGPMPAAVIIHEADDVEPSSIDHLIRKGINQRINGTARLGK